MITDHALLIFLYACNFAIANAFINQGFSPTNARLETVSHSLSNDSSTTVEQIEEFMSEDTRSREESRRQRKLKLFGLMGTEAPNQIVKASTDKILADPITKEPLTITTNGPILGGQSSAGVKVSLKSSSRKYVGRTDTYFNLLSSSAENEYIAPDDNSGSTSQSSTDDVSQNIINRLRNFVPGPFQSVLSSAGFLSDDYIPMRDLFTSPSVSFAYERGWRQGFAAAGFPGADEEYKMVKEYFAPLKPETVVDMSCATGLFTRRLAKGNDYTRVIGCDYSDAMLMEARSRIRSDTELSAKDMSKTQLDLIRCDVGEIPMVAESIDALHAGAAMHCWPDLDSALSEINRVLKPGSRFFATTFLAPYFRGLRLSDGEVQQQQAFQYFETVEVLEDLMVKAGFEKSKVQINVLGEACVVIKAEKS